MGTVFSPKELSKIYTRIKISHNPMSYSFRDRLIEYDCPGTAQCDTMPAISFDTERTLLHHILKGWGIKAPYKSYGMRTVLGGDSEEEWFRGTLHKLWDTNDAEVLFPTLETVTFVKTDHLGFCPTTLAKCLAIEDRDVIRDNILETLITVCYMCTTPHSICADLKWLGTSMPTKYSYEQLHSMQFLKDALDARDIENMPVLNEPSAFSLLNTPVVVNEGVATLMKGIIDTSTLCDKSRGFYDEEFYFNIFKYLYLETIAFGLEIAYNISKHTSDEVNRAAYHLLTGSMKGVFNDITNLIYQPGRHQFKPALALSENSEERFMQISGYLDTPEVQATVDRVCKALLVGTEYVPVPALFGAVISFAKNHSLREVRVKQCAILYNYCKANKLLPKAFSDMSDLEASPSDAFLASVLEMSTSEDTKSASSMMSLETATESSSSVRSSKESHDSASVSQALDGLIGNFRTEKYKFNIKDVYTTDAALKDRYERIASSIKLVNAQLIKQIRDIKTYNVGGKHAGLSSGKLDRKALYKYKADKNIFYQNTYKQKECDLAFGIVLDASGSMHGRGIDDGKTTMIVLHETLKALGINHSIIDHTCYGGDYQSDLRRYQCFKEDKGYRLHKNYALAGITAESGNCDSGALWFMEKALLRTKNKDKICLIFSDGAPTECSGTDLVEQVRHMERNGIKVIGIGIRFPNISKYYSEYANGNNLKQTLDIVAGILKEYVLTKKN